MMVIKVINFMYKYLCVLILFVPCLAKIAPESCAQERISLARQVFMIDLDKRGANQLQEQFNKDRQHVLAWFEDHRKSLQSFLCDLLPDAYQDKISVILAGSYRWATNHPLSDIDINIVIDACDERELSRVQDKIMHILPSFYWQHSPSMEYKYTNPKTDLHVCKIFQYSDAWLTQMNIDCVCKSKQESDHALQEYQEALDQELGEDAHKRVRYAVRMLFATYLHDVELKKSMRIVPAHERLS